MEQLVPSEQWAEPQVEPLAELRVRRVEQLVPVEQLVEQQVLPEQLIPVEQHPEPQAHLRVERLVAGMPQRAAE